jgi:hypothetical protein
MTDPNDPAVIAQERQELRQSQIVLMQSIQAMLQTQTDDRNARIAAAATQGVKYVPPPKTPAIPADLDPTQHRWYGSNRLRNSLAYV